MRFRIVLAAALIGGLLVPSAVSAQSNRFWGVHVIEEPSVADFRQMERAGIGIARIKANWRQVEPQPPSIAGVRHYHWDLLDRIVAAAAQSRVQLHFGFGGVPGWVDQSIHTTPMVSEEGRRGWRAFLTAAIERYGAGGTFWAQNPALAPAPIRSVQIWNEQNSGSRYRPRPDPAEYAGLLRLSAPPLRAIDPGIRILPGGMFGTPQISGSIPAWAFLRRLYAQPGVERWIDGIAVHPYGANVREVEYQVRRMRKTIRKHGDPKTRMHVTEIGWSSGSREGFFYKGPQGQKRLLNRSFKLLLSMKRELRLGSIFWHAWKDLEKPIRYCGACLRMGLVRKDLTPKPSFKAYRKLARR